MARPFRIEGKSGWWIRYTDEFGKRRKKSFEAHAAAQNTLDTEKARVAEVKAGLRDPTRPSKLYSDLADYWTEFKVPQKRSGSDDLSIMKAHLRPFFGEMKLAEIGVAAVDRYLAKKTVNNHLTLLITQLNLAFELRWIARVPRIKKPKVRIFDADYSYLRTKDEIRRFLTAAGEEGEAVLALYATAVYTGMRAGELAGLRWDDVNFETRLITVQRSFDGPTKAGDVRYVPLLELGTRGRGCRRSRPRGARSHTERTWTSSRGASAPARASCACPSPFQRREDGSRCTLDVLEVAVAVGGR